MRRWWLVLALLLSLGVNVGILATLAVARLRPAAPAQGAPEKRLARLADRLKLEGDERQRFLARERRFFANTGQDRKHLQQIYRQVRRELIAVHPDPERLDQLLAESSQVYLKIERSVSANVLETRKMLSPEQESIFLELIEQMRPGQGPFTQPNAPGIPWNRGLNQSPPSARRQPPPASPPPTP